MPLAGTPGLVHSDPSKMLRFTICHRTSHSSAARVGVCTVDSPCVEACGGPDQLHLCSWGDSVHTPQAAIECMAGTSLSTCSGPLALECGAVWGGGSGAPGWDSEAGPPDPRARHCRDRWRLAE